ncbi:hypothetical protein [Rhizobium sp. L51/94]|uniref:hypothetical protein n=1 Tax=Rhizobium sp. L51/94 TaxID=2819999 RepID=UPI001C5B52BE|nr:hypothetical protein [Rhizobium sp. L51/94]QXZ80941.1 hypothetical protein J5274_18650 [Rhizobium sp. L51/94]
MSGDRDAYAKDETSARNRDGSIQTVAQQISAKAETTVDGRPVNKSNPMPVTIAGQSGTSSSGGWWDTLTSWFSGGNNGSTPAKPSTDKSPSGGWVPRAPASGEPSLSGSNADVVAYFRKTASKLGIDPNIALRVAGHEGLKGFDPTKADRGGDGGSSFGPFQLHYGGINPSMPHAGLGDEFTKATGLDARNSSTWKEKIDFALAQVRKGGWSPWMGAKAEGIIGKMGVGRLPSASQEYADSVLAGASSARYASSTVNNNTANTSNSKPVSVTIGDVHVNAPHATDSKGIASSISGTLQQMVAAQLVSEGQN